MDTEFSQAPLPDKRLQKRLVQIAARVVTQPADTFPQMAASDGELEAIYRFLNNDRVAPAAILAPHQLATWERARRCHRLIAAHDTTEFENDGEAADELGYITAGKRGFFGHFSLLLGEHHEALGIAALETLSRARRRRKSTGKSGFYTAKERDREIERWRRGIEAVEAKRPANTEVIHVMDRGADSYELFAGLVTDRRRFVVRARRMLGRVAATDADERGWGTLGEVIESAAFVCSREVPLSRRRATTVPKARYAPRKQRRANLEIVATAIELRRPRHLAVNRCTPKLRLSMVRVHEVDAPEGEEAVDWLLVSTEPIGTRAEVEAIVDSYRARWKIEEYFKALKTGCGWRGRQLESRDGLLNTLALLVPIAWHLLALRDLAETDGKAPANTVFSAAQLTVLRSMTRRPLPQDATVEQALLAVAGQGGHLMRNGRPGWQSLGRGLEKLWWATLGYRLGRDDAGAHPEM